MATKKVDPALSAITELRESLDDSFSSYDKEQATIRGDLAKLETKMHTGFKTQGERIISTERNRAQVRLTSGDPQSWDNPGKLDAEGVMVAEWVRGFLLAGATGSSATQEQGLRLMERAIPGEHARVREYYAKLAEVHTAAPFDSADDYVPTVISRLIDRVRFEPSFIADVGQMVTMGSDLHKVPKETTAPAAANYDENETIAEDAHVVGSTTLDSIKGAKIRNFAIEAVQDASPDIIMSWIDGLVGALNELETQQALEGAGTGNNFTGVKIASSVNEVDLVNGGAVLADLDLLAEMVTAIPASERDPKRCAWFASSDGLRALLQIQKATELDPMLGQTPKSLFGFPIIVSDQIATTAGTPDTSTLYFGNWRGVLVGRRKQLMIDTVPAGAGAAFAAGQVSVRVIRRYAVATHIPTLLVRGINLWVAA